jgi:hypothetical protein
MAKGYWEVVLRIEGEWEKWENTLKKLRFLQ